MSRQCQSQDASLTRGPDTSVSDGNMGTFTYGVQEFHSSTQKKVQEYYLKHRHLRSQFYSQILPVKQSELFVSIRSSTMRFSSKTNRVNYKELNIYQ